MTDTSDWIGSMRYKQGLNSSEARKQYELGQYMTPPAIARQMAAMLPELPAGSSILDPAAGEGSLLLAAGERGPGPRLVGIELDRRLAEVARSRLARELPSDAASTSIVAADFCGTDDAETVERELSSAAAVIANPPYGWGREYEFLLACNDRCAAGTVLVFLVPLALIERVDGIEQVVPLAGRPLGVTTGHAIIRHRAGQPLSMRRIRPPVQMHSRFRVFSGVKLYEQGAGTPPQTADTVELKPYSSTSRRDGWLPCVRTGDVQPGQVVLDRLWVSYGQHLAHPKSIERFTGPRIFVRRVPIWKERAIGAAFIDEQALCAGDVLVVRDRDDDAELLRGLSAWLCSTEAARLMHDQRPSLKLRSSYPKFSGRDLTAVLCQAPDDASLRRQAAETFAYV